MNWLLAFGAIIVGFLIEIYLYTIIRVFGHLDWAEERLGPGGTYTAWRVIGILMIIGGFWFLGQLI